jgi:hypothetical protein
MRNDIESLNTFLFQPTTNEEWNLMMTTQHHSSLSVSSLNTWNPYSYCLQASLMDSSGKNLGTTLLFRFHGCECCLF